MPFWSDLCSYAFVAYEHFFCLKPIPSFCLKTAIGFHWCPFLLFPVVETFLIHQHEKHCVKLFFCLAVICPVIFLNAKLLYFLGPSQVFFMHVCFAPVTKPLSVRSNIDRLFQISLFFSYCHGKLLSQKIRLQYVETMIFMKIASFCFAPKYVLRKHHTSLRL